MLLRPAYPDELARAKTLLNGHPVPESAGFLVGVKELPIERLVAAIPWWKVPLKYPEDQALRFFLHNVGQMGEHTLCEVLTELESLARENDLNTLLTDFSLPEAHPLYTQLISKGYQIAQTDRYFTVPAETVIQRSLRIHARLKPRLPESWQLKSIKGQAPGEIFKLIVPHGLISPQAFLTYWNTANREHFEERYSRLLFEKDELIGAFLLSQRGSEELHIHVEAAHPEHLSRSRLISAALRHASFSQCIDGFPKVFTWRADSVKHRQTGNTALRQGGTEGVPRHFLKRILKAST